jgi:hypothetical protein
MKSGFPFSRALAAGNRKRMRGPLLAMVFLLLGVAITSSRLLPRYQGASNVVQSARTYPPLSKRNEFFIHNLGVRGQMHVSHANMSVSAIQRQTFEQSLDLAHEEG